MSPKHAILAQAKTLGFDQVGVTSAILPEEIGQRLMAFLDAGHHGDMAWMQERAHQRSSPHHLWSEAKSAIVLGLNYGPTHNPLDDLAHKESGTISVYARHRDYHDVLKKKLKALARFMSDNYLTHQLKLFVDTAPVMEKPLAGQAGLGWQGKHSNLVSRQFGSWLFLGVILTTLELEPDTPEPDHCGGCTRCLDICPTQAIIAPYQVDARRCISYLTIENKGHIPHEFRHSIGNRIYGCDDCLSICPWNKFAQVTETVELKPKAAHTLPPLAELLSLDDTGFRARFSGSPIKRIGRDRFIRNVLIASGNSGQPALLPHILPHLQDPNPIVRAASIWAVAQLAPNQLDPLKTRFGGAESDPEVQKEWELALNEPQR